MTHTTPTQQAVAGLLLALLALLGGCQATTPDRPSHGQSEAIPGSGMPDFPDGGSA